MRTLSDDDIEIRSRVLVRQFTEKLVPTTCLEKATKKAQAKEDDDNEVAEQVRVQKLVDRLSNDSYVHYHPWNNSTYSIG